MQSLEMRREGPSIDEARRPQWQRLLLKVNMTSETRTPTGLACSNTAQYQFVSNHCDRVANKSNRLSPKYKVSGCCNQALWNSSHMCKQSIFMKHGRKVFCFGNNRILPQTRLTPVISSLFFVRLLGVQVKLS